MNPSEHRRAREADERVLVRANLSAESRIRDYLRAAELMAARLRARDEDGFRRHLFEAGCVYPAIWDHLDEAAAAARRLGRRLDAFELQRSRRDAYEPGVPLSASESRLDLVRGGRAGSLVTQRRVTIALNPVGLALARRCTIALRAAGAGLDWKREEPRVAAPRASRWTRRATGRARRLIGLATLVAAIALIVVFELAMT